MALRKSHLLPCLVFGLVANYVLAFRVASRRRDRRRRAEKHPMPTNHDLNIWKAPSFLLPFKNAAHLSTSVWACHPSDKDVEGCDCPDKDGKAGIKIWGRAPGAVWKWGKDVGKRCSAAAFDNADPLYGYTKGCWCVDLACKAAYAPVSISGDGGGCQLVTLTGHWKEVASVGGYYATISTSVGMSVVSINQGSEASFSASMSAVASSFNFLGIVSGSFSAVQAAAESRFKSHFASFSYNESKNVSNTYWGAQGRYLYQFHWEIYAGETHMLQAKENFVVQANVKPRCLPGLNKNVNYSECTLPMTEACDWQCYLNRYPNLQKSFGKDNTAAAEEWWHREGRNRGDDCTCRCNWQCYLNRYPDLQLQFGETNYQSAEIHFQDYGKQEGRDCSCHDPDRVPHLYANPV